jgi:hypothetical protein
MSTSTVILAVLLGGLMAGLGIRTLEKSSPGAVFKIVAVSVTGAFLVAFLLPLLVGVLQELPVEDMTQEIVESVGTPVPAATLTPTPTPTLTPIPTCTVVPTSTPCPTHTPTPSCHAPGDCSRSSRGLPPWLIWLLFTPDKEG